MTLKAPPQLNVSDTSDTLTGQCTDNGKGKVVPVLDQERQLENISVA
jgi:hypothetical protein